MLSCLVDLPAKTWLDKVSLVFFMFLDTFLTKTHCLRPEKPYKHQSMFWSDLGPQVGYEAIGIVDAALPTVGVFAKATQSDNPAAAASDNLSVEKKSNEEPVSLDAIKSGSAATSAPKAVNEVTRGDPKFGKGVLFYIRDEKVVGIVLWNVFNRINTARAIINENKKWDDLNELAKLFEIHA